MLSTHTADTPPPPYTGKLYNLSAFALFPPITSGVPVVASIAWTGQFKVGSSVSVDVTMHDASHARSRLRMGWAYPGDSSSVSWIDAPVPLDAVPVITITRRDVGSVLVCDVLPVGSAGQEGERMYIESQPVQADAPASPTLPMRASTPAPASHASDTRAAATHVESHSESRDDRPSAAQPLQASPLQSRTNQQQEAVPQLRDDRPSMIQSVSVVGDGVVGSLMRSHVAFPMHEMATASAMSVVTTQQTTHCEPQTANRQPCSACA